MKSIFKKILIIGIMLSSCIWAHGQIQIEKSLITISNNVIQKEWEVSSKKPMPIIVSSLIDITNNREVLAHRSAPWFEFVVNHTLVTSNDSLWKYIDFSQRPLRNKGTEYMLHFKGVSGVVKGLYLSVKEQLFPGSTLIREQLILHVENKDAFELNKYKGKLHFIFPQYTYKSNLEPVISTEIRVATWNGEVLDSINSSSAHPKLDGISGHNLSQAHMFHPRKIIRTLKVKKHLSFKGPIGLVSNKAYTFMMAYEHASQDNLIQGIKQGQDSLTAQKDLNFLQIEHKVGSHHISSDVKVLRGGYLAGQIVNKEKPYKSIWTANGFYLNKEKEQPGRLLYNYLLNWITKYPKTRETKFYYNTWGMQRNVQKHGGSLRGVLNYERIFKEIRYAHQMGVKIFVLDDGWEEMMGVWKPSKRLNKGLNPILDTLKRYNMALGVWMSPLAIDPRSARYKKHQDWLIRDQEGNLVKSQGNVPVFDFVSGYFDLFVQDCKWLIDHGVRYFKWDALGTYYPYRTKGYHGNLKADSKTDIIARYGYLFPLYIKKAMTTLIDYNPDVVVEIDLTENVRALMGLSTMSAGKLFFMNNGASEYGDYSQYRAKSMRTIANEYAGIVPLQLFTYANYTQNSAPYRSQRYNVNSSIIAGRGLWGNLSLMTDKQRLNVRELIKKADLVSPYIQTTPTSVIGKVGASPEIYTKVNTKEAAGQAIAFSGSAMNYTHQVVLNDKNFLGVLDNAFSLQGDTLQLPFQFPMPDASREAFIIPNQHSGIHIISCSSWLDNIQLSKGSLKMVCGAPGKIAIIWPRSLGYPKVKNGSKLRTSITTSGENYLLKIHVINSKIPAIIQSSP